MNRRKSIKQLAIAAGGVIILPQWMISCGISDSETHSTSFSISEQELLASIVDTIIPAGTGIAGEKIGALAVGTDKFLQKLIDDCYDKEAQDNVKAQLKALAALAKSLHDKSFADCNAAQRKEMLMKLSSSDNKAEKDFFNLVKSETIRGFNTSQKVMQEYLGYKVAPGHYHGCVDVKA